MFLYVYKDFILQGVLTSYNSISWVRRYNDVGQFELKLPFNKDDFDLLEINNIAYKKDTLEGYIILDKTVEFNSQGEVTLIVKGSSLNHLLSYRVFSYKGNITLQNLIHTAITNNFISPTISNRRIDNFYIKSKSIGVNLEVNTDFKNADVLTVLRDSLQSNNVGFKINYLIDIKKYEFEIYKGVYSEAVFSRQFNNISEQEYFLLSSEEKNTKIGEDGIFVNNNFSGLNRKETASDIIPKNETLESVILDNSIQYLYLKDWNLGDIVTFKNNILGLTITKNVIEIEEFYDPTGRYLTVYLK